MAFSYREGADAPSAAQLKRPVTYVSLSDAQAFCAHYKARLPHTWEWQYFASNGSSAYPWGSSAPTNETCPPVAGTYENLSVLFHASSSA